MKHLGALLQEWSRPVPPPADGAPDSAYTGLLGFAGTYVESSLGLATG